MCIGAVAVGVQVVYGVIAQSVVQRTQEIAIRMAMSATRENILRGRAFLGLSGTAIGSFGALVFARLIEATQLRNTSTRSHDLCKR